MPHHLFPRPQMAVPVVLFLGAFHTAQQSLLATGAALLPISFSIGFQTHRGAWPRAVLLALVVPVVDLALRGCLAVDTTPLSLLLTAPALLGFYCGAASRRGFAYLGRGTRRG